MTAGEKLQGYAAGLREAAAQAEMSFGDGLIKMTRELARAMADDLDLFREQEAVKPKVSEWLEDSDPGQEYGTTWACRKCKHSIHDQTVWNPYRCGFKFCPFCGAEMKVTLDD